MAPKGLSPAAKQALIMKYFHESGTAHSIKELEKVLPSVASINGMQVKDQVQALVDDGKIRVEKIGSNNWYWAFPSEGRRNRENMMKSLREEHDKLSESMKGFRKMIQQRQKENESDEKADKYDRAKLVENHGELTAEVEALKKDLERWKADDPAEFEKKKQELRGYLDSAEKWTDKIYTVEGYILEITNQDRQALENLRRQYYGDEYVEGEGLRDL